MVFALSISPVYLFSFIFILFICFIYVRFHFFLSVLIEFKFYLRCSVCVYIHGHLAESLARWMDGFAGTPLDLGALS